MVLQPLLLVPSLRVQLRRELLPTLVLDVPPLLGGPLEHRTQLGGGLVALEELHEGEAVAGQLEEGRWLEQRGRETAANPDYILEGQHINIVVIKNR